MNQDAALYRGAHAGHPAMADARRGICRPGNTLGTVTPQRHNDGGAAVISPYTSWTFDSAIAAIFANSRGPGDVILVSPAGAPPDPAVWHWGSQLASDDDWWENEVSLWGVKAGLGVETP
jgi:hypothetical protein